MAWIRPTHSGPRSRVSDMPSCQAQFNYFCSTPLGMTPRPWQRIHIDFAGPFQGANFLVAVDAHSKWPEVGIMGSTTTKTIEVLRKVFASNGLPEQVRSLTMAAVCRKMASSTHIVHRTTLPVMAWLKGL